MIGNLLLLILLLLLLILLLLILTIQEQPDAAAVALELSSVVKSKPEVINIVQNNHSSYVVPPDSYFPKYKSSKQSALASASSALPNLYLQQGVKYRVDYFEQKK
jgi:hypothetical protein